MNKLAEVCFVGLGERGNYVRCLVISIGFGGAMRFGGDFKVIILRGGRERGQAIKRGPVFMSEINTSIHYEGCSHYVILLF